jgi:hypothetical protein
MDNRGNAAVIVACNTKPAINPTIAAKASAHHQKGRCQASQDQQHQKAKD